MTGRRRALTLALLALAGVGGLGATTVLALAGRDAGSGVAAANLWLFGPNAHLSVARLGAVRVGLVDDLCLAVLAAAWAVVGWLVWRRHLRARAVLAVAAVWAVPLVVAPPLFSPDVYEYVAFGSMVRHGLDPYRYGPVALHLPVARGTDPFWARYPSPYGPGFLVVAGAIAGVVRDHLLAGVVAFRAVAVVSLAAVGLAVRRLAQIQGAPVPRAVWLVVANPVVLIVAVSAAHNDVLMMAFVAWGMVAALTGRPLLGVALIAVAATIKVVLLVLVAVVVLDRFGRGSGAVDRLRRAVPVAVVGGGVFVALTEALGFGWGWWHLLWLPTRASDLHTPVVAAAVAVTLHLPHTAASVARAAGTPTLIALFRKAGEGLIVVSTLLALAYQRRLGPLRAAGLMLVALVVFGPVLWPWYLLWPLVLLAASRVEAEGWLLAAASVALLFVAQPGGVPTWLLVPVGVADDVVLAVTAALAVAAASVWVLRRRQRRSDVVAVPSEA